MIRTTLLVLIVALAHAPGAVAQPARSFAELRTFGWLNPGDKIKVQDASGRATKGVLRDFGDGSLIVLEPRRGVDRRFVEADVRMIRRTGGRAVGYGLAIGAGAALLATYAFAAKYGKNEGGEFCSRCFVQWAAIAIPLGAGGGAAIGFSIDPGGERTLYLAPGGTTRLLCSA